MTTPVTEIRDLRPDEIAEAESYYSEHSNSPFSRRLQDDALGELAGLEPAKKREREEVAA